MIFEGVDFDELINAGINDNFKKIGQDQRNRIELAINDWLVNHARKRRSKFLEEQMQNMKSRISELARTVEFEYTEKEFVVKSSGAALDTLKMLRHVTDWFDPHPDITAEIARAITEN